MINILFVHHAVGWGGAPINMVNIINNLDNKKYKAKVLLLRDSVVKQKLIENNINYSIAKSFFYKKFYKYFSFSVPGEIKWYRICKILRLSVSWILSRYYFARKELENHVFDIVQLNSSVLTDWLKPARNFGKVIIHIQEPISVGTFHLRYTFFRYQIKKNADKIIAISKDNARRLSIPEKTDVIYNFLEDPNVSQYNFSYESKQVLYLGGNSRIKGFFTLVDALNFLDKGVKVIFAGSYKKPKKENKIINILRCLFKKKEIQAMNKIESHSNATLIGFIDDVTEMYNQVCCLVSPFLITHFSRPIIEANLHKKPAISTDIDGIDELIENKKNGIIVPKNNPKILADSINFICKNPEVAKVMGENGYKIAQEKFSKKNTNKYEDIYNNLISEKL